MSEQAVVIYRSFYDGIQNIEDLAVFKEFVLAVLKYGFEGIEEQNLSPHSKSMFPYVKAFVDAYNRRRSINSEKGKSGGAPKGNQNARKDKTTRRLNLVDLETTQNNPKQPTNTKTNTINNSLKKDTKVSKEMTDAVASSVSVREDEFKKWLSKNFPIVATMQYPFTLEQYEKLKEKYTGNRVMDMLRIMENYKPLKQKNRSAYQTFINWINKEGKRTNGSSRLHTSTGSQADSTIGTNFRESDIKVTDEDRKLIDNILANMQK